MVLPSVDSLLIAHEIGMLLYRKIILLLSQNDSWKEVAAWFEFLSIERLQLHQRPAELLLDELGTKLCTVGLFCEALEDCQLYNILCLLKNPEPPVITEQPTGGRDGSLQMIRRGSELRLTCKASGIPPPTYQWICFNKEIENATDPSLVITNFDVEHEGEYSCIVSQAGSQDIFSNIVTVELLPEPPVITMQPSSQEICLQGASVEFKVVSEGYPFLNYQWYKGNILLDGETDSTLKLFNVTQSNEGYYTCWIQNIAGEILSNSAHLSIIMEPPRQKEGNTRPVPSAKLALLLANQNYEHMKLLNTAENDVVTLADNFVQLGFDVIALQNLSLIEMRNAVKEFCKIIPVNAYVVFYFAGHGFTLHDKFMLPIDAPGPEDYLQTDALSERELLQDILSTKPKVLVELLDMCLKIPDPTNTKILQESKHIHSYEPDNNLIQGYATTNNLGAYEKKTDTNGLYVKHLQRYMKSDISIVKVLENVAKAIERENVGEKQRPYFGTNVTIDFRFTDRAENNAQVREKIRYIFKVPDNQELKFENTNVVATLLFSPYRKIYLNTLHVTIKNLDSYELRISASADDIKYELKRHDDLYLIIKNIQKIKYEKSISLQLWTKDSVPQLIGYSILDLKKPMIGSLDLWCEIGSSWI